MLKKKNEQLRETEKTDYWISYSDMMAGLILTFILILTVVSFTLTNNIEEDHKALDEKEKSIIEKELELDEIKDDLIELKDDLDETKVKLDSIVGVRQSIIQDLIEQFSKTSLSLEIDKNTGAIALDNSILYDYNSSKLTDDGKKFLSDFIPLYLNILLSHKNKEFVSEIIIEGHTDDVGPYIFNLELSQDRALSVVEYIFSDEIKKSINASNVMKYLSCNGKSFSQLKYTNGLVDADKSRRVEFKFRLKEDEMIAEMDTLLSGGE